MRVLRAILVGAALAAPAVAVAAYVDLTTDDPDDIAGDAVPFETPVTEVHRARVELPDGAVDVVLSPNGDFQGGACLEVQGPNGGTGTCGALADLQLHGNAGVGWASDGVNSSINSAWLVEPEVESAELLDGDETVAAVVVEMPGRPEKLLVVAGQVEGEPSGITIRLLGADGAELEELRLG